MKHITKRVAAVLLTAILALTLTIPALSFAQPEPVSTMTGLMDATGETEACVTAAETAANTMGATNASMASSSSSATTATSAESEPSAEFRTRGNCTATIQYMENPWSEDPDNPSDENGRLLLGTYEITGLHEGDVLNAWDYVVDIPGHFFFDGWPYSLTVSSDSAQNVMTLIYVKLWDCEYTVNYYVMEGADLTADNWSDALKPESVTFTKVASETVGDQIYDTLVKGDAYEYQMDGMYVIDTYPAEIRVGLDPDDNVINVLYTTSYATGPDNVEVWDDYAIPGDTTTPEGAPMPDDSVLDKDDIIDILPDGAAPGDEVYDDFLGTTVRPGELVVTDEMLQHPVNKTQAELTAQAYATGLHQNSGLAQTGDQLPWLIGVLVMGAAIVALVIGMVVLSRRSKKDATE